MAENFTGVCLVEARDLDALASLAELAVEEDLFPADVVADLTRSVRRARAALTKRLRPVLGGQVDSLVEGRPTVCQIQDAE